MFGCPVTLAKGAKWTMTLGGSLCLAGSIAGATASNVCMLILGRLLVGIGISLTNQAATVYILEMVPYKYRGALYMFFPFSISCGIVLANVVSLVTKKMESNDGWRLSLGLAAVPALLFNILGSITLPDTPTSLIQRDKHKEAMAMLTKIHDMSTKEVDQEFDDMVATNIEYKKIEDPCSTFCKKKYSPHLALMFCILLFQQLTKMITFMFYAPVLFKTMDTHFGDDASSMLALMSSGVNCIGIFVSIILVQEFETRRLFIVGGVLIFLSQVIITICTALKSGVDENIHGELPKWYVVIAICVYVLAFVCTWGPLGWLVPSEIFPREILSAGQSFYMFYNMIYTFFGTNIFLNAICKMKFGMFIFFSFFAYFMTYFAYDLIPETKGVRIEDMEGVWKAHHHWKRYVCDEESNEKVDIEMSTA